MPDGPQVPDPRGAPPTAADPATSTGPPHGRPPQEVTTPSSPAAATPADPAVTALGEGSVVGKYRLAEAVGDGGMGVVYRAVNPDLGLSVALKLIRAGELARPDEVQRFLRECRALARFRHPHIVAVHDAGQHHGRPFLVMEYLPGGSLARNLARYQADPRAAVALVEKVARAVGRLHAEGVLHRDLKPANVLLDDRGEPRVSDFGLVKLLDGDEPLTRTEHRPGTPPYMAPEQTGLVDAPLGPATDVWALGVMLYELLLSRRPFTAADVAALFRRIATQEPDRPRALRPDFDAELEAVLLRCLAKDPARRFADATELADELARWLQGERTKVRPEGRLKRFWRRARRRPLFSAAMVFLVLAVVAVPFGLHFADPDRPSRLIRRQLERGEEVTLVRPVGWALPASGTAESHSEGSFGVEATRLGLLDLVRGLPPAGYRLEARVRHLGGDGFSQAGLYVLHAPDSAAPQAPHLVCEVAFNEVYDDRIVEKLHPKLFPPGLIKGNAAILRYRVYAESAGLDPDPLVNWQPGWIKPVFFPFVPAEPPPHHLAIEVRPGSIEASFDGNPIGPMPLATAGERLAKELDGLLQEDGSKYGFLREFTPSLEHGGSLGLLVYRGRASFSDVTLKPLPIP
jgi:hypothetical protein